MLLLAFPTTTPLSLCPYARRKYQMDGYTFNKNPNGGLLEVLVKAFLANIAVYKERKHCISENSILV